jgi:hypothetical protein
VGVGVERCIADGSWSRGQHDCGSFVWCCCGEQVGADLVRHFADICSGRSKSRYERGRERVGERGGLRDSEVQREGTERRDAGIGDRVDVGHTDGVQGGAGPAR